MDLVSELEKELMVARIVLEALDTLDEEARQRVITYAHMYNGRKKPERNNLVSIKKI